MSPISRINVTIDSFLARRGFHLHDVRTLVRNQLCLVATSLVLFLGSGLQPWAAAFCAGVMLITVNFWFLAKGLQGVVQVPEGAVAVSLVRFYGRMILTGLLLFVLIVWGGLSVPALLAGLSTVIVNILVWGVFRYHRQNVKEA